MAIRVGNKADGEDFFDRETERQDFWRYLRGNSIVLSGPRRLGKTSLLQRIAEEGAGKALLARLVDVEGLDRSEDFIAQLAAAFPDNTVTGYLRKAGTEISALLGIVRRLEVNLPGEMGGGIEFQAMPETPWREDASRLQERLSPAPLLILIDEFTVFLEKLIAHDAADAARLLSWLRTWRQTSGVACRFVFSGSIGFNSLLERHGFSNFFNDCYDLRLGPFREIAALSMLKEVAWREGEWLTDDGVLKHLCARTCWLSPFYLNLLLAETLAAARDREMESSSAANSHCLITEDVDDGYDRLLATRSRFIHWYQRLERDFPEPELSLARAVLAALAREKSGNGLTRSQLMARLQRYAPDPEQRGKLLDHILLKLEEDGYLGQDGDRFHFLSFLLRDYWRRNHG